MPIHPDNRRRYPANWPQIRARILKRAQEWRPGSQAFVPRCECHGECGRATHAGRCPNIAGGLAYGTATLVEGRHTGGSTVVLTIAHLDHTPENNSDENLRAMCQGCHLHYDREHHAQSRITRLNQARVDAGQTSLLEGTP